MGVVRVLCCSRNSQDCTPILLLTYSTVIWGGGWGGAEDVSTIPLEDPEWQLTVSLSKQLIHSIT